MCYSPITLKSPNKLYSRSSFIQVPCGKCLECLKKKQNEYAARMEEEYKSYGRRAMFVTLTYREDTVPKNYYYREQIIRSKPHYSYDNTDVYIAKRGGRLVERSKVDDCFSDSKPQRIVAHK